MLFDRDLEGTLNSCDAPLVLRRTSRHTYTHARERWLTALLLFALMAGHQVAPGLSSTSLRLHLALCVRCGDDSSFRLGFRRRGLLHGFAGGHHYRRSHRVRRARLEPYPSSHLGSISPDRP